MLIVNKCPLCASASSSLFDQRQVLGFDVTNRMCLRCGLVYMSPRMDESELREFYERNYRVLYQGTQDPTQSDLDVQLERALHLADLSRHYIPTVSAHLDLGCAAGLLMQALTEARACVSVGVEPSIAYRAYASDKGFDTYESLDHLMLATARKFDLVTLSHVLEHLPDPVGTLVLIRRKLLQPDAHIVIEVPNLYGHGCFEPAHLFSFTAATLRETVRKAGFRVVVVITHGIPRATNRPLYLTLVGRAQASPSLEEYVVRSRPYGVKFRRQWAMRSSRTLPQLIKAAFRQVKKVSMNVA